MILSQTGYSLSAQRLFVNNAELRDDQTLSNATQHVKSGSIIGKSIQIFFKTAGLWAARFKLFQALNRV
jgi:hypothetical protein